MRNLLKLTATIGLLFFCQFCLYAQGLHGDAKKLDSKNVKVTYVPASQLIDTIRDKWRNSLVFLCPAKDPP